MAIVVGPGINVGPGIVLGGAPAAVTTGLQVYLDSGNPASYPGTGTTWTSLVGAYSGTMGAGVSYSAASGGSLVFNGGSTAVVTLVNSTFAALTNNFSIECWYKASNNQPGIIANGTGSNGFVFGYFSGASPANSWKVTKYGVIDIYVGSIPQNTAWHQVVLTYSSTAGTIVYVDGASNGTSANVQNLSPGSTTFNIGKSEGAYLNGSMAIQRWYNTVLSAADVSQNFNADRARFGI